MKRAGENYSHIGNNLRRCRRKCGLTQQQVKALLQNSGLRLADYENGHRLPTIPILLQLADLYGVDCGDLLKENPIYPAPFGSIAKAARDMLTRAAETGEYSMSYQKDQFDMDISTHNAEVTVKVTYRPEPRELYKGFTITRFSNFSCRHILDILRAMTRAEELTEKKSPQDVVFVSCDETGAWVQNYTTKTRVTSIQQLGELLQQYQAAGYMLDYQGFME